MGAYGFLLASPNFHEIQDLRVIHETDFPRLSDTEATKAHKLCFLQERQMEGLCGSNLMSVFSLMNYSHLSACIELALLYREN